MVWVQVPARTKDEASQIWTLRKGWRQLNAYSHLHSVLCTAY